MSRNRVRPPSAAKAGNRTSELTPAAQLAAATHVLPADLLVTVFNAIPDALVIINDDETIIEANAVACAFLALARDQVVGKRIAEFLMQGADYSAGRTALLRDGRLRGPVRLRLADGQAYDMIIDARARVAPGMHMIILRDVTEPKPYQQAIRAAERSFQAVFDSVGNAILMFSADHAVRDANAAAATLFGRNRTDLLECRIEDLFVDPSELLAARKRLAAGGRTEGQAVVQRPSDVLAVNYALSAQRDSGRSLLILYEPSEPTTECSAGDADPMFRRMFESSPAPTLVCDRDTLRITAVNQAAVDEYGYSREAFVSMTLGDLRPPAKQPRAAQSARSPKGHDQGGLWRQQRRDGSFVDADVTARLLDFEDGHGELIISHEPSPGRAAARQFTLSVELFEASTQAITITDADAKIIAVNPAFTTITGYEAAEVIGRNSNVLSSGRQDKAFYESMWNAILSKGHWQGELWDRRKSGEVFPVWLTVSTVRNSHGEILQYMAMFSDVSDRKAAEAQIEYLAHYDQLTGLANRALLQERFALLISQAQRHRRRVGVLFLDLDRFKKVNDTLGHSAGDAVLQETARRLRACLRQADFVARQGGDEFIVLINDVDVIQDAAHVAQKIIEAMARRFELQGHAIHISPSIGISVYPDDGSDIETLLKNADVAMYQAKSAGRNNYQFFTHEMNETALVHLAFEHSLRRALDNGEFLLQYQPQVAMANRCMTGVEALVRWHHPETGIAAPGQFVPIAEESGLIVPIGAWILREVCTQAVSWRNAFGRSLRVSVNVSPLQFRQRDFVDLVSDVLQDTGIDPGTLELEFTEAALMHDADAVVVKLRTLRDAGVRLSIDDFGTGYSCLSYLKRFPIDRLKIDQSFVQDIGRDRGAEAVIEAIVGTAHSLRIGTLAVGVETEEQSAFLCALGCEDAQGYLFSLPLEAAAVRQRMESETQKPC